MPINMTDYRMIINERVYNVLQIMIDFAGPLEEGKPPKPKLIDAVYIDEDLSLIHICRGRAANYVDLA